MVDYAGLTFSSVVSLVLSLSLLALARHSGLTFSWVHVSSTAVGTAAVTRRGSKWHAVWGGECGTTGDTVTRVALPGTTGGCSHYASLDR